MTGNTDQRTSDGIVYFSPGCELHAANPLDLLPRLRLDPAVGALDLMSESLTVVIDDMEYDVDPETAMGAGELLFQADDGQLGYLVELCGAWLHHWAEDAVDEYVLRRPEQPLEDEVLDLVQRSGLADLVWSDTSTITWSIPPVAR